MTGPNVPNQPNFNTPPPGPGNMPPQYPQPPYGNMPPQHQQYPPQQYPHQQYPQQPNQYGNQAPPVSAYLSGNVQYPAGLDLHLTPIWDPGSPDGTTRPVQSKVSARPPQVYHGVFTNRPKGRYIHEDRQRQKTKAARENYTQRGSEQVFDFLPRVGRFLGRVAFKGTTTSPERIQAGYSRKEVGGVVSVLAGIGVVALHATLLPGLSYGARTAFRFTENYIPLRRTFKDSFRTVVAKKGEAPHQIRGQVAAESFYENNPFPHLGGNTAPTSPRQARRNNRQAARNQRAQQLQAQQGGQPQAKAKKKKPQKREKEKGF